jgi:hypothetical protein
MSIPTVLRPQGWNIPLLPPLTAPDGDRPVSQRKCFLTPQSGFYTHGFSLSATKRAGTGGQKPGAPSWGERFADCGVRPGSPGKTAVTIATTSPAATQPVAGPTRCASVRLSPDYTVDVQVRSTQCGHRCGPCPMGSRVVSTLRNQRTTPGRRLRVAPTGNGPADASNRSRGRSSPRSRRPPLAMPGCLLEFGEPGHVFVGVEVVERLIFVEVVGGQWPA